MNLTGAARLAGIAGWPVAHSLSPRLHGHWLAKHKIDGAYVPMPVSREGFASVLNALQAIGFAGINVTVPHKEAAFALAHEVDDAARAAGAANLLVFREGRILGRNTDAPGFAAALKQALGAKVVRNQAAVVLGAGGAARAVVLALSSLGAVEIRIVNRVRHRAEMLAATMKPFVQAKLTVVDRVDATDDAALLVNATSAGMHGNAPLDIPLEALPKSAAVCDIVYNPLETDLLKYARTQGHRTVDGLGMLMHQAVPSFEAFFGVRPKVTPALRKLLEAALHG
ncbi:MAG TPA: shikimate dehydrogenase [Rhizomicrobium sp.]|jgi:shikimate dehydrogenase